MSEKSSRIVLFIQKRWFLLLIGFCSLGILPYLLACLYIHPFFDDFIFADQLKTGGRAAFFHHYYFDWTGRYSNILLWAFFNCKIIPGAIQNIHYVLFGIFLITTLFLAFLYFINTLLKDTNSLSQRILVTFVAFAFYLAFMPEVFSAFYWYDASYYQLDVALVLFNLALIINYFKGNRSWKQNLILVLLNIYISGTSEILVITLGIVYVVIIINQYFLHKRIDRSWIIFLLVFAAFAALNIFSPGNFSRVEASHSGNNMGFSIIRAFYDFLLFHISYTCFKTPFLFLLLLFIPWATKTLSSNVTINRLFNVNPWYALGITIFIFYLHHALSVYGAGYSLQGRVINFSILLFWIACFYNSMILLNYLLNKKQVQLFQFNSFIVKMSLVGIVVLFTFSDNNRLLWGDLIRELPSFHQQLSDRYDHIRQAKERGEIVAEVPKITALPKLYLLGEDAKCGTYNFANDPKYLREAAGYFKIGIKTTN